MDIGDHAGDRHKGNVERGTFVLSQELPFLPAPLTRADLLAVYTGPRPQGERVGIEVEIGSLDPATGRSLPYHGETGVQALLAALLADGGGEPILDGPHLVGFTRDDGFKVTLEHGGALEYCSPPATDLVDLATTLHQGMTWAAGIAESLGAALVPGGNVPFNTTSDLHWVPKPRGRLMREFFADLGEPGALGADVMGLGLATQATLDYLSTDDLIAKVRMLVAASPVAGALFANSPLENGGVCGSLSRRMETWFQCDPARCGLLPFALQETFSLDDVVEWSLALPMIYRRTRDGHYERAPRRPFSALLTAGFDDGTLPAIEDWISHLMQVWPDVRLRNTIEMRVTDGPGFSEIPAVPAFWTGLAYHAASREAAWELLRGRTAAEYRQAMRDAARYGLAARYGREPIRELAVELVRLAREGVKARIAAGLDGPEALSYLEPLSEILESGKTFAERARMRWEGGLAHRPERWVEAYRIQPPV
jgi:glutamate--cysteine ligase